MRLQIIASSSKKIKVQMEVGKEERKLSSERVGERK